MTFEFEINGLYFGSIYIYVFEIFILDIYKWFDQKSGN